MTIHILKLCVGCATIEDLATWQAARRAELARMRAAVELMHVTCQTPRRQGFGMGSSLYWVIAGCIRARQTIGGLREVRGADGIMRCGLILDGDPVPTEALPRRPFQGWRYLSQDEAPVDVAAGAERLDGPLPPGMRNALAELCLL